MAPDIDDMGSFAYMSPLDICMEEKVELERRLAVALGLLASCQLELGACTKESGDSEVWWTRVVLLSSIR